MESLKLMNMKNGLIFLLTALGSLIIFSCGDKKVEDEKKETTLCDCVIADYDKVTPEVKADCLKIEDEWEKKYESSNDEEQSKMMEEIQECEKMKPDPEIN